MPILLNDKELDRATILWGDDVIGERKPTARDYVESGSKAQLKHIYELLKEDTTDWCFGVSEELRAELKKEAGL